ncbi:MAG: TetR/AcrR family transcriptional regulator [Myxococcota bacterium]
MSDRAARPRFQRARRQAEKAERREAILAAASAVLQANGFEGFSMSVLAARAGMAKATLYLYFETREEVLLALYVESLCAWSRALREGLRDGMGDDDFVALFQATTAAQPGFASLRARLESVIEHNVSRERLIEAKRAMRGVLEELAPEVERSLRLAPGTGARLIVSLGALQLGTDQSRLGPAVTSLDLPEDVAEFMRLHSETDLFRETAPFILAGIRRASRD